MELNDITAAELRVLLREHALVVAPGEVLVVQVPPTWSPVIMRELSDGLRAVCSDPDFLGGVTIPVLVVPGTAVTVAKMPEGSLDAVGDITGPPAGTPVTMRPDLRFSYLALEVNALLAVGRTAGIAEVYRRIDDGTLFTWLEQAHGDEADFSLLRDEDKAGLLEFFRDLSHAVSASKYGVSRNGLCLLLAYCLDGIQHHRSG